MKSSSLSRISISFVLLSNVLLSLVSGEQLYRGYQNLFPAHLDCNHWLEFPAQGFTVPVSGVIYQPEKPTCCGMPLGGISTGCLDIDNRGVLGFCSSVETRQAGYGWGVIWCAM